MGLTESKLWLDVFQLLGNSLSLMLLFLGNRRWLFTGLHAARGGLGCRWTLGEHVCPRRFSDFSSKGMI